MLTRRWFPASAISSISPSTSESTGRIRLPTSAAGSRTVSCPGKEAESNQPPDNDVQTFDYAFAFCFGAQRALIKTDNFFLAAALIVGRAFVFAGTDFFGEGLRFHFAQRCFMASEIRLRAAALICRPWLRQLLMGDRADQEN